MVTVRGKTALGYMANYLGLTSVTGLSGVFSKSMEERSPSWIQVYREMMEWSVLFYLVRNRDFGSDTVEYRSMGFLGQKNVLEGLFGKYQEGLEEGIEINFDHLVVKFI